MENINVAVEEIAELDDDFAFADGKEEEETTELEKKNYRKFQGFLFLANRKIKAAIVMIGVIVLLAIFGPYANNYKYDQLIIENANMPPRIPGIEKLNILDGSETVVVSSSEEKVNKYKENKENKHLYYWFGSDSLGRDLWTRTWIGTRISLYVAIVAVFMDLVFGLSVGLFSGYIGGRVDFILQRIIEIINSIPTLIIVTLLLIVVDSGLLTITLALILTGWIRMSRIAREQILEQKEREYVLAAKTIGNGPLKIILKEILPNIYAPIITNIMFSVSEAIFTEAFLSFVGLGVQAPMASLGLLISDGYNTFTTHPYQIMAPVLVLVILILSFNILADGIREVLNP